jgi:thioesterase domain-containing protein/acyl carrier protein
VPAEFIALGSLPLTASGKVDHARLPAPGGQDQGAAQAAHVVPRAATEQQLAEIWCAVLGETRIGVRDDFFRLGGNSLKITQIIARANEAFGVGLNLRDFFRSPTVGGLAELVDARRSQASDDTAQQSRSGGGGGGPTELREGDGAEAPLFLLHPGSGPSVPYALLCQELPAGIACYGVEADLDADANSIDELAQSCVSAILAMRPHGPYRLAGWSVGAALAHATAVQLRKRGARVEVLALLDAQQPPLLAEPPDPAMLRAAFADNVALTAGLPPVGPTAEQLAGLTTRQQDDEVIAGLIGSGLVPGESAELVRSRMRAFTALVAAAAVWRPEPYDGRIDLFTTGDTAEFVTGWSSWTTGSVVVHPTAGGHFTMMRPPHVAPLGQALGRLLTGARAPEEDVLAVR